MVRVLHCLAFAVGLVALDSPADPRADDKDKGLKFEIYKAKNDQYRWRLKSGANNAILAVSGEGYKAAADARRGVELVQKAATDDKMKFETYEDEKKEHRWRLKAANGQIVASSSEGYKNKADMEKAVDAIKTGGAKAEVVEIKE